MDVPYVAPEPKVSRNDLCPRGSGKKYKKCHGKYDIVDKLTIKRREAILPAFFIDMNSTLPFDLKPGHADPLEILALTGGERQTDNLEVFPKIERSKNGGFNCRFFLHGWRHVNEPAQKKLSELKGGEHLRVAVELNNPATVLALQLQTPDDYHMIGWAPRYLVKDLFAAICESPNDLTATVVKVNLSPAPAKQRVLIEIKGRWMENYEPMSTEELRPLMAAAA